MNLILDASVAAAWCFPDERTDQTERLLELMAEGLEAAAPRVFAYEVRNVVLKGLRRERIGEADAFSFLSLLGELPIRLFDPRDYDQVFRVARQFRLNFYDAAYLELALRLEVPLATLDKALASIAVDAGATIFDS